jgi:glycine cleavage system H protein
VHADLPDNLDLLVDDPFEKGWMLKIKVEGESPDLLDASAYEKLVESEG